MAIISSEMFFRNHYRELVGILQKLAEQLKQLKISDSLEYRVDLLNDSILKLCGVFNVAFPGQKNSDDISRDIRKEILLVASKMDFYNINANAKNPPATILKDQTAHYEKNFDIGVDYAGGSFRSVEVKDIYYEYIFQASYAMILVLNDYFRNSSRDPRNVDVSSFFEWKGIFDSCPPDSRSIIEKSTSTLEGWCSEEKTWLLYDLVRKEKPVKALEIGIYGGRSIIPIAQAMKDNGFGSVTGIEGWSSSIATEEVTGFANDFWWSTIDFRKLKENFFKFCLESNLINQIRVLETSSHLAHYCVDEIDFLHIDGNHSAFAASQDVVNYFRKLKPGGVLVFDDINWPTTHPALDIVLQSSELLHVVSNGELDRPGIPGCAAFRKI